MLDMGTGLRFFGETQPARRQRSRHGAGHPPALGPRAGPAVLRARARPGGHARHLRARRRTTGSAWPRRSTASCARRTSPSGHRACPATIRVPRARRRRRSGRRRQGHVPDRCPTSARPTATASSGTARRSPTSPTTSSRRRRSLDRRRGARAVRRRRPAHPRRAVHACGVRDEVDVGPLHRRVRGAGSRKEAGAKSLALVPPRPDPPRRGPRRAAPRACASVADQAGVELIAGSRGSRPSRFG